MISFLFSLGAIIFFGSSLSLMRYMIIFYAFNYTPTTHAKIEGRWLFIGVSLSIFFIAIFLFGHVFHLQSNIIPVFLSLFLSFIIDGILKINGFFLKKEKSFWVR